jgi:uncharacterized protein YjcR
MTLKAQILTLWCRGRSYDEIVEIVGCRREYVRAIISRSRLQLDPEWQARTREYKRAWRARKMMAPRSGGEQGAYNAERDTYTADRTV